MSQRVIQGSYGNHAGVRRMQIGIIIVQICFDKKLITAATRVRIRLVHYSRPAGARISFAIFIILRVAHVAIARD